MKTTLHGVQRGLACLATALMLSSLTLSSVRGEELPLEEGTAPVAVEPGDTLAMGALAFAPLNIGVYIPGAAQDVRLLDEFESQTGPGPQIVPWYQPWGFEKGWYQSRLDTPALRAVAARGATPMITWEAWGTVNGQDPSRLKTILTGAFDSYIDSWASGLKEYGGPVYLRLFHEMNNPRYPWAVGQNGNTAQDQIDAWRYVYGRFQRAGATNVLWVWSPNTENDSVLYRDIYPGDAYVDWIGIDGYNGGAQLDWGGWRTPQEVFGRSYRAVEAISPSKPVMIAETGTVEAGGSKAEWIQQLYQDLPAQFPRLRSIVWFHADFSDRGEADWRLSTSESAFMAFQSVTATPPMVAAVP